MIFRQSVLTTGLLLSFCCTAKPAPAVAAPDQPSDWPTITQTAKPWAYWWWLGSAVDTNNLARELARYRDAGLGGVHIIPIYGAKGWESNYISYLSPKWLEMLSYTVSEARRLDLGVDMTTGTGWCFGGPRVTDAEANASVVWKTYAVPAGGKLTQKFDPKTTQAIMAYSEGNPPQDLTSQLAADGTLAFTAASVPSVLYVISQRPSGQQVKRASPGGAGHMLNLASPTAMTNYLRWFDEAFANYRGAKPRAQYHDSYEYRTDWSPEFFAEFQQRRGYQLQDELPALFANAQPPRARGEPASGQLRTMLVDPDRIARVKCDYRATISDLMAEVTLPLWADWSRRNGFLTRNEAHGSPGNWLDLYAAADIPETEMFYKDRNKLISKFASSAAHTQGKPLVGCETGTWLNEHFTETLADMKYLLDDLFLSGVNHVFYHGCCYSPDEAGWPGWLFYASYEMNPRNSIWRDVPALNAYVARCQAVLQAGKPDNDLLLYWPLHDFWSNTNGLVRNMSVHARDWFEEQPIGKLAKELWDRGYAFDYVSDAQLKAAKVTAGKVQMPGGSYQVIVVPECRFIPLKTFKQLLASAEGGATVVFDKRLPEDVSGLNSSERTEFRSLVSKITFGQTALNVPLAATGKGCLIISTPSDRWHSHIQAQAEPMVLQGLSCVRRSFDGGWYYFVANRTDSDFAGWITLGRRAKAIEAMDPLSGRTGVAVSRPSAANSTEVHLQLSAGESIILRAWAGKSVAAAAWNCWQTNGQPAEITGQWKVSFVSGGPTLPAAFLATKLASWTRSGDTNAEVFAGTATYTVNFDKPAGGAANWRLDLGKVCQSARVRLNNRDLGTLITAPFRVVVDSLKPTGNLLEVEVTSVAANRIRDLDRRGVPWKNFHDINIVNLSYKPFDASGWPLTDCGLLGPVTLTPVMTAKTQK